jgi:hypothetical protein
MRDEFEHIIDQFRQRDNLAIAQLRKLPSGSHIGLPRQSGGDDPIRTDGAFQEHSALAVRCLRPRGHVYLKSLVGMERFELSRATALVSKTSVSSISTTSPRLTNCLHPGYTSSDQVSNHEPADDLVGFQGLDP